MMIAKIEEEYLVLGNRKVAWDAIVGRRLFGVGRSVISRRLPCLELFLIDGDVVRVYGPLTGPTELGAGDPTEVGKDLDMHELVAVIDRKAPNLDPRISAWIEWRFLLPTLVTQLVALITAVMFRLGFEQAVSWALMAGVAALPFGFFWERSSRRAVFCIKARREDIGPLP